MSEHFNQLTPSQTERLDILAEECAEVIQAISKIKRHGFESTHPNGGPTNRQTLERELGDLAFAKYMLQIADDVNDDTIQNAFFEKGISIQKYLHHNQSLLEDSEVQLS